MTPIRLRALLAGLASLVISEPSFASSRAEPSPRPKDERPVELQSAQDQLRGEVDAALKADNFALALDRSGQLIDLLRQTTGDHTADFGEALYVHALILRSAGRAREAEPLDRKAFALSLEFLGPQNHFTLSALSNLCRDLMELRRWTEAEPLLRRLVALHIDARGEMDPQTIIALSGLSEALGELSRPGEAEAIDRRALRLSTEVLGEKHLLTISILADLATDLSELDRKSESEPLSRRASALFTEVAGEKDPKTLKAMNGYALTLLSLGRLDEAEKLLRKVLVFRTAVLGEQDPESLSSLNNLAGLLTLTNRQAEGEQLLRKALEIKSKTLGRTHPSTLASMTNLALAVGELSRAREAETMLREVVDRQTQVLGEQHLDTVSSMEALSHYQLAQPERAHLALATIRRAVTVLRSRQATAGIDARSSTQRSRDALGDKRYYEALADALWSSAHESNLVAPSSAGQRKSKPDLTAAESEAFVAMQDAMVGSVSEALALQAARRAADLKGVGALALERQQLVSEWASNEMAQSIVLGEGGPTAISTLAELQKRTADIDARLAAIDVEFQVKAPEYHAFIRPSPLTVAAAQSLLKDDEAVLMILPTSFGTHVVALTADAFEWTRATTSAPEIKAAVSRLRAALDPNSNSTTSYDRQTAFQLYQTLVAPMKSSLAGKHELFVVVAADLLSLPFGVLVAQSPHGDDGDFAALRDTHYLADDYAITQLPSLQSLAFLRIMRKEAKDQVHRATLAGFGDPKLSEAGQIRSAATHGQQNAGTHIAKPRGIRGGGIIADVAQLRALPSLPGTSFELMNLAKSLGAPVTSLHLREADTETAVRNLDLSSVDILSFATHGLMAGEASVAEPGLVFTPPKQATETDDGLLTASEVSTLRLNADWVILSACNTAAPSEDGAPGLSGLARAFFYAGGRSLLVSHWPVYDDVAPELTVETIRIRQNDPKLSKAEALTRAMYAIRHDTKDLSRAHPSVWGPFSLIGENR